MSIAIETDQFSFQFFCFRVHTASCGANVDHGVLALGYDIDAGSLTIVYPPDYARAHLVLDVGSGNKKTVDRLFDCLKSSRHSKSKLVKHEVSVLDVVIKIARGTKGIDINSCTQHILNYCATVALWMIRTNGTEECVLSLRSESVRDNLNLAVVYCPCGPQLEGLGPSA